MNRRQVNRRQLRRAIRRESRAWTTPGTVELEAVVVEFEKRLEMGRCVSCAARNHECEGGDCNCPKCYVPVRAQR